MRVFQDIYRNRRVLVTGHTGFKGSWLALWLHQLGADISGISLDPATSPNHWDLLQIPVQDHRVDIRDLGALQRIFHDVKPEIVFHLAAQPLVRRSYRDPLETWTTNVIGTANVLESCRQADGVGAIVVVTSDKCYENREWHWGYRETDALGGYDPYSASKAGAEMVAASYRSAFFSADTAPLLATARAGNVIGGSDFSEDRLVPDLVRSIESGQPLYIRSPKATRPWQHVLESLSGYLLLGQRLLEGKPDMARAWNFGPDAGGNCTVEEMLARLQLHWPQITWKGIDTPQPHEAGLLSLDSSLARHIMPWQPVWDLDTTLARTAEWYRAWLEDNTILSREQLAEYVSEAARLGRAWTLG
jgi:CDP-glucose 4,6-dehydratase